MRKTPGSALSVGITALASDADATNNTITYTLDDDAGGQFAIDGIDRPLITVNAALDYESKIPVITSLCEPPAAMDRPVLKASRSTSLMFPNSPPRR